MAGCVLETGMTWPEREEVFTVAGISHEAADEIANVPVAIVSSRIEAELIVGMLRNNGLGAVVSADDAGGQEPPLQTQGVRVLVTPSGEASARLLLAAIDDTPS
jgi:hypothetical protein